MNMGSRLCWTVTSKLKESGTRSQTKRGVAQNIKRFETIEHQRRFERNLEYLRSAVFGCRYVQCTFLIWGFQFVDEAHGMQLVRQHDDSTWKFELVVFISTASWRTRVNVFICALMEGRQRCFWAYTYMCIYVRLYMYAHMRMHAHAHLHVHVHARLHKCTCAYDEHRLWRTRTTKRICTLHVHVQQNTSVQQQRRSITWNERT